MRRLYLLIIFLACPLMMFGQLKVQSNGDVIIGSFLGTNANVPVVFKVNNNLAGSTGNSVNGNISFGYASLSSSSLSSSTNTAVGFTALKNNASGGYNSAFGYSALYTNTTGGSNTACGFYALQSNTSGYGNSAFGYNALQSNMIGYYNTAIGNYALYNSTGSYNTAVGYYAGDTNGNNYTNSTSIGYNASIEGNNQVKLGNSSVAKIGGYVTWSTYPSDGRAKKNIRAEVPGLTFINLLQPVTYNLDLDAIDEIMKSDDPKINNREFLPEEKEMMEKARANKEKQVYSGFIAQDVEKAARSVGYDFSGVDAPENDKSVYGLRYAEFVVPLVKAVQELSEQNDAKDAAIVLLQEQVNQLNAKLDELIFAQNHQSAGVIGESNNEKNFSFSIFPNPTNGFVTVDYTLYADAPISIELYNMYGQRVKLIAPKQSQKVGTYSLQTSVAGLGSGTYIVKVSADNQIESKQLIVN